MKQLFQQYQSMPKVTQLLLFNQFTINLGFYMLMPKAAATAAA